MCEKSASSEPQTHSAIYTYSVFSCLSMFCFFVRLFDFQVLFLRASAFALVCLRFISEVGLFLPGLALHWLFRKEPHPRPSSSGTFPHPCSTLS